MPSLEVNGLRLEYETAGDAASPPILLIMGLGMPSAAWPEGLIALLVRQGFRVIRFDNRDCGGSSRMKSDPRNSSLPMAIARALLRLPVRASYTLDDMALDAETLLDALQIRRAHVVGVSMGGMIAQVLATRLPHRVASLTSIMSGTGNPRSGLGKTRALHALLSQPEDPHNVDRVIEHYLKIFGVIGSPGFEQDETALREHLGRIASRGYDAAGTARQLLAILASGDRRAMLGRISAPTLVIHGADDPLLPAAAGRETARCIRSARLLMIAGMGHDLPGPLLPRLAEEIGGHCHAAGI
ncbi:MAG: alpha/beta hydrolase [Burkholderiaceae bacterium]